MSNVFIRVITALVVLSTLGWFHADAAATSPAVEVAVTLQKDGTKEAKNPCKGEKDQTADPLTPQMDLTWHLCDDKKTNLDTAVAAINQSKGSKGAVTLTLLLDGKAADTIQLNFDSVLKQGVIRFPVGQGAGWDAARQSVFQKAGFDKNGLTLSAALAIDDKIIAIAPEGVMIRTGDTDKAAAILVGVFILLVFILTLLGTDVMRDRAPAWFHQGQSLAKQLEDSNKRAALLEALGKNLGPSEGSPASEAEVLTKARVKAMDARVGKPLEGEQDVQLAVLGLTDPAAGPFSWKTTYSLARVQIGCWTVLTVLVGLVYWTVQGSLPVIPPEYLALLGMSTSVTGLSWSIDVNKELQAGMPSRNLLSDLVQGNGSGDVHRFQAVIVNLVLLVAAAGHFYRTLTFMPFENSWLILLGGSGVAYLGGKQVLEKGKKTE